MSSCYFARLAPEKGFDIAVWAFIELARQHPEARFHVGGWLAEKDRAFYEVQIERIAAAGLSDRFRHVEAPDGASKMAFLEEIDVFTVPARFIEPKGLYLLEAMACGLPVVVTDRGAFPEMIASGGEGCSVAPTTRATSQPNSRTSLIILTKPLRSGRKGGIGSSAATAAKRWPGRPLRYLRESCRGSERVGSREDLPHHLAIDVGEAEIAPLVAPRELLVIKTEEVQDGGVEVVEVDLSGDRTEAECIGLAVHEAAFDSAAGHPGAEALGLVFAVAGLPQDGLDLFAEKGVVVGHMGGGSDTEHLTQKGQTQGAVARPKMREE